MALSANMAGAGAGNAMAMTPGGMGFGANAMAAPQAFSSFEPPPTAGPGPSNAGGPGGAGGAYDLRAWEKKDEPDEDMHACLGVDVGTSNIKVPHASFDQDGRSRWHSVERSSCRSGVTVC